MNREKQIETTDWLTRGIPKEQLERKKREAIMSNDLQECITYDEWSAREYGIESIDFDVTAEKMVAKGYRKQSEGEWMQDFDGDYYCPFCAHYPREIKHYCPNCGARMKGGD